ncbi:DUF2937 family protein [Pararhizobium gei]|uniref:DUF2937 family protein n=1 Tax=Pararhizobium gei TaxID=1395951 RepID=UPI0023D9BBDD|nr:DUF2937 family protein [Rhizobium gei]
MGPISRLITLGSGIFGAIVMSQAPELTQQYRQRIGGAMDELRVIVENFDREANRNAIDRETALGLYAASAEPFLKDQGVSMRQTLTRFQNLEGQQQALEAASPIYKPFILIKDADPAILENTWRDFIPAVPVSLPGMTWAAIGFGLAWLLCALTAFLSRGAYRLGAGRTYRLLH